MHLTRRDLIKGAAAATAFPSFARAATDTIVLEPRQAKFQLLPEAYPESDLWLFGGSTPGPEIRVAQGARVERRLVNSLPQATSVHWHGIRIDNAMDGVPGLTQEAVAPGETFDYSFVAPDAGTYWYHSHNQSTEQVARGLYGALIVEENDAPDVDSEHVLVLGDWLLEQDGQLSGDFASRHERSHSGRTGNYLTTNGTAGQILEARRHERMRLRLINGATARVFELGLFGLEGWVVALDGMPLERPEPLTSQLVLAPAQRVDLIVDVTAQSGDEAYLVRIDSEQAVAQATFKVGGEASVTRRPAPAALPPNQEAPLGSLAEATRVRLLMEGGAMGGLQAAIFNGERRTFRQLVQDNQFWSFNGEVGLTDEPLINARTGETVRLEITNDTVFPHAMHLHGQHFREVEAGGGLGPMRDTILVSGRETREIAFVASNPGDWLFHCHMLSHQDAGMKTWMRVRV
jgi:FtsP/CotA-like multicopper oxidase with cupredoxin domain